MSFVAHPPGHAPGAPSAGRESDEPAVLLHHVRTELSRRPGSADPVAVAAAVASARSTLTADEVWVTAGELDAELRGLGPLQGLVGLPTVTDILVNAPTEIWVDSGAGLVRQSGVALSDEHELRALAVRLAALAGRRLDEACPSVDGLLPSGIRLHAILPPVAVGGTKLSLRLPARTPLSLSELVRRGAVPPAWVPILQQLMRARLGFLVSGGTGTGKTTVLGALLSAGAAADRVVIVEDTTELRPSVPHVVSLQARHPNTEGAGAVTLVDLVRQALRMRPDRIVVGECRGAEVTDLLAALNTGHCGCGTVHANSAADVPARLEALGMLAGLSRAALQRQVASGLQVVLHLERNRYGPFAGRREAVTIGVVEDGTTGVSVLPALTREGPGPGWARLADLLDLPADAGETVTSGSVGPSAAP